MLCNCLFGSDETMQGMSDAMLSVGELGLKQ